MTRIALTLSYPQPPTDEKDVWRLEKYLAVVQATGASIEPLYLDDWENRASEVAERFDGLLLSGGADLPTELYGEAPLPGAGLEFISPRRPRFEREVVGDFLERGKPILGICYGCQFLNVFRGGALVQDIELQLAGRPHPQVHVDGNQHSVRLESDSQLARIVAEPEFLVPSYHHQAVSRLAPDAKVSSYAPDGVVESVEWDGPFCLGVQWHPERAPESNATRRLMEAFVGACD